MSKRAGSLATQLEVERRAVVRQHELIDALRAQVREACWIIRNVGAASDEWQQRRDRFLVDTRLVWREEKSAQHDGQEH